MKESPRVHGLNTAGEDAEQLSGQKLLVQYLTQENRELSDSFPELAFFRDIVYYFKAFMTPSCDSLPERN